MRDVPAVRPVYERYAQAKREVVVEEFVSQYLVPWMVRDYEASVERHVETGAWRDLLDVLEREYSTAVFHSDTDPRADTVVTLVQVYVEIYLPSRGEPNGGIRDYLGPQMSDLDIELAPEPMAAARELALRILDVVPALTEGFEDNTTSAGEFLGYTFLSHEVTPWVVQDFLDSQRRGSSAGLWKSVLEILEVEYTRADRARDEDRLALSVANLIEMAFVDSLPEEGEPGHELVNHLGPNLKNA